MSENSLQGTQFSDFRCAGRSNSVLILARDRGEQRIVTEVTDQVLRDVYAALVLGSKMEIPV